MKELLLIICAYLIGSIPTALIVSKRFFGIDIRDYVGSPGTELEFAL